MIYKNSIYKILVTLTLPFLIFNFGCSKEFDNNIVARVDDVEISTSEFQLRYNFNPYLKDILNPKDAKRIVLSSLIAEKILFLEGENHNTPSDELIALREQYLAEAMIEKLRQDSIESQIEITEGELKQEYLNSIKEIDIKFVAFNTLQEAKNVKQEIDNTGSYEKPIRKYMNSKGWYEEPIPEKKISWGKEKYELEKNIYRLDKGETSNPVSANNEYYLIYVQDIRSLNPPSNTDFKNRLPALQDRIRREKIRQKYFKFFNKHIKQNMGNVDWNLYRSIVDVMVSEIQFTADPQMSDQNKPLSEIGYNSLLEKIRENMGEELIRFPDGTSWSIEEVLHKLNIGPYAFNFSNETLFRRSCARNIELLQEHHFIQELAKNEGYENKTAVKNQFNMWNTFYSSNELRYSVLDTVKISKDDSIKYISSDLTLLQNKRLSVFDRFLTERAEEYKIKINKKIYDSIELNKQDMVVVKSHFANRLISPPLEPLISLPNWSNKINSILRDQDVY